MAGNPLPIDRESLANELKFFQPTHNSIDSIANRDFVCNTFFHLFYARVSKFDLEHLFIKIKMSFCSSIRVLQLI